MNLKKVNDIFGIALSWIGLLKVLLIVLVMFQSGSIATAMVIGGDAVSFDLSTFSTLLGYAQLIVAAGSIVMIFVNIKRYPDVILGYIIGLGAITLEFILHNPIILGFFEMFCICFC